MALLDMYIHMILRVSKTENQGCHCNTSYLYKKTLVRHQVRVGQVLSLASQM